MRLVPEADEKRIEIPDLFTERILQARLIDFWKGFRTHSGGVETYDPLAAEERYTKFQSDFLQKLPPQFALNNPSYQWDKQQPYLLMQRQLIYITAFESICQNFRSLLLLRKEQIRELPAYKRVLKGSQSRTLAHAALSELEAVSTLHSMLGASHTRYTSIITPTFEASVILLCLCLNGLLEKVDGDDDDLPPVTLIQGAVEPSRCIQAAQKALDRLKMLTEVSIVAEVGARNLSELLQRVTLKVNASDLDMVTDLGQNQGHVSGASWSCDLNNGSDSNALDLASPDFLQPGYLRDVFLGAFEPFIDLDEFK
jgi:hypothetical protein